MNKEPRAMREIHEIREHLYEKEKGLSGKELIEKIHQRAQECIKKYGLKLRIVGNV